MCDDTAFGIYQGKGNENKLLVGHAPVELLFLLCKYIVREGCYLEFTPAGRTYIENGLVLGTYSTYAKEARLIRILKDELDKKKKKN